VRSRELPVRLGAILLLVEPLHHCAGTLLVIVDAQDELSDADFEYVLEHTLDVTFGMDFDYECTAEGAESVGSFITIRADNHFGVEERANLHQSQKECCGVRFGFGDTDNRKTHCPSPR
jgi:hypothetical protein